MPIVPRVKICGITSLEDAHLAIDAGADAVGFLVGLDYETVDEVSPEQARQVIGRLPIFVSSVFVTHLSDPYEVLELCRYLGCSTLQLHGSFPLDGIGRLRHHLPHLKIFGAVHVEDESMVEQARRMAKEVDAVILDSKTDTRLGGTGMTHDWQMSREIRDALAPRSVILAGGLDSDNVAAAIRTVEPYGVDVNTGVSAEDGRSKSADDVWRFVQAAKQVHLEATVPA